LNVEFADQLWLVVVLDAMFQTVDSRN